MAISNRVNSRTHMLIFAVFVTVCILPVIFLPILDNNFHTIYKQPIISDGLLNVKDYDFEKGIGIPLDGKWEFYWNKWIITDKIQNSVPDAMINVPSSWEKYSINHAYLPSKGYASYKINVKNWPSDRSLTCYIPNVGIAYRVFFNGEMVASRGGLDKEPNAIKVAQHVIKRYPTIPFNTNMQIVIEVDSLKDAGLYLTPILIDTDADIVKSNTASTLAGIYLGIMLIMIAAYGIVLISSGRKFYSIYLLLFVIIMSFKIFMRDEFYGISAIFHLEINLTQMGLISYIITMLSPVVFLFCLKEILHIKLLKHEVIGLVSYCIAACIIIIYVNSYKKNWVLPIFALLTLPYIILILYKLINAIKYRVPHAMSITVAYILLYCGIIVDTCYANSVFVLNMSMYLPLTFCIFLIIIVVIYAKQNAKMQSAAIEAENLRLKIRESETDLMLSQIKPHFIFNSLTAILALIRTDPKQAEQTVKNFSKYLRTNMTSIESKAPIPFEQELKHVKIYVDLELVRFQNRINVIYDIKTQNFKIPPLTIQPLVENSIRHGICKKKDGGTVIIRTYEASNYIVIEIQDNGIGFDTDILTHENSNSLGIKNVQFRLSHIINANLTITSQKGNGTFICVQIPIVKGDKFI